MGWHLLQFIGEMILNNYILDLFILLLYIITLVYGFYSIIGVIKKFKLTHSYAKRSLDRRILVVWGFMSVLVIAWAVLFFKGLIGNSYLTSPVLNFIGISFLLLLVARYIQVRITGPKLKISRVEEIEDYSKQEAQIRYVFFGFLFVWIIVTILLHFSIIGNNYIMFWFVVPIVSGMSVILFLIWIIFLVSVLSNRRKIKNSPS